MLVMAYLEGQERAAYVQTMFDRIAGRYDVMNRLMTAGQDVTWRRYVIQKANVPPNGRLLDIATGTGDIAYEGVVQQPSIQTVGADFSLGMMQAGRRDYAERRKVIKWTGADALALPFADRYFDASVSGFLMRNVIDVAGAFAEQFRVLKPGGRCVVLESSPPKDNLLKPFILAHLNYIIPTVGKLVAGESDAYQYLPESTQAFRDPDDLAQIMREAGFVIVSYKLFMFGTVAVHFGVKPL
jgi:demethylmenaquinone methyltransferase/2-methoxy-6-polyprenyl-1,4-benzoquinol methylase